MNGTKNPHKVFGYLRTPEFSQVPSDFILSGKSATWQRFTGKMAGLLKKVGSIIPSAKKK
jgi:hypothetical protein